MKYIGLILALAMTGSFSAAGAELEAGNRLLLEIGKADGGTAEFALGPGSFADFEEDGFFAAGFSEASRDWPYVHPGPQDAWAGGRPHTFVILFSLAEALAGDEKGRLHVRLADTHYGAPPVLEISVNGQPYNRKLPAGTGNDDSIHGRPETGSSHEFTVTFPLNLLKKDANEISIRNATGSWILYDWIGLEGPAELKIIPVQQSPLWVGELSAPPVIYRREDGPAQAVEAPVRYFGNPVEARIELDGRVIQTAMLKGGWQTLEIGVPPVTAPVEKTLSISAGATRAERAIQLEPVRHWEVHMLHHTHLDIGYTHHQSEVARVQWDYFREVMELGKKTADYPPEARFKWLPECLWAVDSFLNRAASPEEKAAFAEAIESGVIVLDALYGNQLTALCRPEELLELTGYARRLSKEHGWKIDSAMITDVPGYTRGIITALARSGVKYFSIGPNRTHRIGYTLSQWGDQPFYWVSPSGREKVFCMVHGEGYSWFHRGPVDENTPARLFSYLDQLEKKG
jgi:alpha-mannosidase